MLLSIAVLFPFCSTIFAIECSIAKDSGFECDKQQPATHFYFDKRTGVCQPFIYAGCGGNKNRFVTSSDCRKECNDDRIHFQNQTNTNKSLSDVTYESVCNILFSGLSKEEPQNCANNSCTSKYTCIGEYCCPSKELICSQIYDSGHELSATSVKHVRRYVYNSDFRVCNRFSYFGKAGNFNNFPNWQSCMDYCASS